MLKWPQPKQWNRTGQSCRRRPHSQRCPRFGLVEIDGDESVVRTVFAA